MNEKSPGARAVDACEIQDAFVIRSECWVSRDYNQSAVPSAFTFGQQSGIEGEALAQERTPVDGKPSFHVLRYFVDAEIRLLKQGVNVEDREPVEDDFLAVLKFTLAVDYRCPQSFLGDKDAIGSFGRNAHFHAWPYLREEVHAACARMRLPRITLPMLKPEQAGKTVAPAASTSDDLKLPAENGVNTDG